MKSSLIDVANQKNPANNRRILTQKNRRNNIKQREYKPKIGKNGLIEDDRDFLSKNRPYLKYVHFT